MLGIGQFDMVLRVVLADQQRVPFALLRVEHRWREDAYHAAAPLVSVVIPCYDQARYLPDAIESVLAQSYPHLELVVVDDGSPDNTAEVAARYPGVQVVRQENAGLSGARNTGLRHTNGAYLIFLDADDRLLPKAVADGLAAFAAHPEAAFVAGRCRIIDTTGVAQLTQQPDPDRGDPYEALLRGNYIWMPGLRHVPARAIRGRRGRSMGPWTRAPTTTCTSGVALVPDLPARATRGRVPTT